MYAGCSSFGSKSKDEQRDEKLEAIIFGDDVEETLEDASPPALVEGEPTLEGVAPVETVQEELQAPVATDGEVIPLFQSDAEVAAAAPLQYWEMIPGVF